MKSCYCEPQTLYKLFSRSPSLVMEEWILLGSCVPDSSHYWTHLQAVLLAWIAAFLEVWFQGSDDGLKCILYRLKERQWWWNWEVFWIFCIIRQMGFIWWGGGFGRCIWRVQVSSVDFPCSFELLCVFPPYIVQSYLKAYLTSEWHLQFR